MKSLTQILSFLLFLSTLFPQQLYEEQIIPFDGRENDFFGAAVAVSDSFLFISSLRYSNQIENAVYVYRLIGDDYEFIYKIHPSDGQPGISGSLFGTRLLYNDGQLFVGAQNRSINNIPVGAVYLYTSYPVFVNEEEVFEVKEFYLSQNYPNPFNPTTRIDFYIPKKGEIKIKVYDITGREITTVLEETKYRGHYKVELDLNGMPTGVYFYRVEYIYEENNKIHRSVITKKAVLIK